MTRSGFKTAQRLRNLKKKENNNKDYRTKQEPCCFTDRTLDYDYLLRTKHGICLTSAEKRQLYYKYDCWRPEYIELDNRSKEENEIISEVMKEYSIHPIKCTPDKTHTYHSKMKTRNRNYDRKIAASNKLFE